MSKFMTRGLLIAAIALGGLGGVAAAGAASAGPFTHDTSQTKAGIQTGPYTGPNAAPHRGHQTGHQARSQQQPPAGYVPIGLFPAKEVCDNIGKEGVQSGSWQAYQCIPLTPQGPWELWVKE